MKMSFRKSSNSHCGDFCEEYNNNNNNNSIPSIQFFIISVLHQQPEGQLQMQHKGRQNIKYNKITTIKLKETTWLQRKLTHKFS
jgi:hypothetical protein